MSLKQDLLLSLVTECQDAKGVQPVQDALNAGMGTLKNLLSQIAMLAEAEAKNAIKAGDLPVPPSSSRSYHQVPCHRRNQYGWSTGPVDCSRA